MLRTSLPAGDAYISRDDASTNPRQVDIWIMWQDPDLKSGTDSSLITSGSASCPTAAVASGSAIVPHCLYFRASI